VSGRNEEHPILLATRMNDIYPVPDMHGGPIRVVVPNQIGARSVKWLDRVNIRLGESPNFYMQKVRSAHSAR
jgi:sulfite oxidase